MSGHGLMHWAMVPFPLLVVAIAVLPMLVPRTWERRSFQGGVVALCAVPVLIHLAATARLPEVAEAATSYASFVATLMALYVTSGGIHISGDIQPTPSTNVALVALGALLASFVGTTGASMLLIRPLLAANRQRENRAHLVVFFIVAVANVGGLLTPLGDPPLLVGYIGGVPFLWTFRLFPVWLLYVGSCALALYWVDRRAYARESPAARAFDRTKAVPVRLQGRHNLVLLLAVIPAAMLPIGTREVVMLAIAAASLLLTPRALYLNNGFTFAPILDVAIIFAGLFACMGPIKVALAEAAPWFPLHRAWQLFWASGLLSSVLDNAPTYTAFAALARGLSAGDSGLVAGISVHRLAAISIGSVVMGATTYIGNGPNLMVKAIAERERFPTPTFFRYAALAFVVLCPAHIVTTVTLALLDR
jgi:Na+/H+ antiporter NhaD/arsenite permease-like protein